MDAAPALRAVLLEERATFVWFARIGAAHVHPFVSIAGIEDHRESIETVSAWQLQREVADDIMPPLAEPANDILA